MKQLVSVVILCLLAVQDANAVGEQEAQLSALPGGDLNFDKSIEKDIKDLAGSGKKVAVAGHRLIDRGSIILKQVHYKLLYEDTTDQQKELLLFILGEIGDESSIRPIISVAKLFPDDINLNLTALSSLENLKQNEDIVKYVSEQLEDESKDTDLLRAALEYFTVKPHKQAHRWAIKYSDPAVDMDVQSMALYLGGLLSIDSFKSKIVTALKRKNSNMHEGYMLVGLAALTKPAEFNSLIKGINVNKASVTVARVHYLLHKGTKKERRIAATKVVSANQTFLLKDAVNYLIEIGDADALARSWQRKDKTVRSLVSKAGLSIVVTRKGAKFLKVSKEKVVVKEKSETFTDDFAGACTERLVKAFDRHCND